MSTGKKDLFYVHAIVTVLFMFGFGFLPAPEPVTPVGMKMVGVFLGLVYGWTFSGLAWPSLLAFVALSVQGCVPMKELLVAGFANDTFMVLLFVSIFAATMEQEGVSKYLASWCITRKVLQGRPWLLLFSLLLAALLVSGFTNAMVSMLIVWSIFYNICKQIGVKPYEKFATLVILGVAIAAILGTCLFPFRTAVLVGIGAYQSMTGNTIDFLSSMLFLVPVILVVIASYLFVCRFIFRVDVTPLKTVNLDFIDKEDLVLNKRQKLVLSFLGIFILLAVAPSLLPKELIVTQVLTSLTTTGIVMALLVIMLWIKVDQKPLVSFSALAKNGIMWDIMIIFAIVLPISNLLMGDNTGVKEFLVNGMQPLFSSVSPLVFMIIVLVIPTVLTNFANNMVVGIIFLQLICTLAGPLGVQAEPLVLSLMICSNLAFLTPAASAPAAMLFGNAEWIKPKDVYVLGGISMIALMIVAVATSILWGGILF